MRDESAMSMSATAMTWSAEPTGYATDDDLL